MNNRDLQSKTKTELMKLAQRLGLRGISTLKKGGLTERIQKAQQARKVAKVPGGLIQKAKEAIKRRAIRKRNDVDPAPRKAKKVVAKAPAVRAKKTLKPAVAKKAARPGAEELAAHKFDVSPKLTAPKQQFREEHLGELPEAYGTGRLFLVARDPRWLFAYWDLTVQQMAESRQLASDGRLVLRVFEKNHPKPVQEHTVQRDARNWYVQVGKGAATFHAELGVWQHDGTFRVISRSKEAMTPPDVVSADTAAQFVTIPVDLPYSNLVEMIRTHIRDGERLAEALHRLEVSEVDLPFKVDVKLGPWTAEQTATLERALGGEMMRQVRVGSLEMTEWLRRRLQEETSSGLFSPAGASWSGVPQKGFWFAVNAELIIYGATEPNAKVTVDGKPITLRSDGTFSFHWAFPDGQYRLPVVAVSAAGDDSRAVELSFERKTTEGAGVGVVKTSEQLRNPKTVS